MTLIQQSTEQHDQGVRIETPPRTTIAQGTKPVVFLRRGAAGNDAELANPETRVRYDPIREYRAYILGELIADAIVGTCALVRRAYRSIRRRRRMWSVYDELRELDDHTLQDLGFHRYEILSVAAEVSGTAECTRVQTILARGESATPTCDDVPLRSPEIDPHVDEHAIRSEAVEHAYRPPSPRVALGLTAAFIAVVAAAALIVLPAKLETEVHVPANQSASKR